MRARRTWLLVETTLGLGLGFFLPLFGVRKVVAPELLLKALNATGGVNELLLAGEEGVTGRTDLDVDLRHGAARLKAVPATTLDFAGYVWGMNLLPHRSRRLIHRPFLIL